METEQRKKTNTGKIGFILALVVLLLSLLLIPFQVSCLSVMLVPVVCLCLIVSLAYCIHGWLRKRNRRLALAALCLDSCTLILLFFLFITFTPPGSVPYPLNIYKVKRACPEVSFWLDFDKEHISDVQSQYTVIIAKYAAVSFRSEPDTYTSEKVIEYAEKNEWKYNCILPLYKKDFEKYDSQTLDSKVEEEGLLSEVLWYFYQSPIIMKEDSLVLAFDSGSTLGYPAYVFLSKDKSKLIVFYQDPILPDPASKFWLPLGYEELCAIRSKQVKEPL